MEHRLKVDSLQLGGEMRRGEAYVGTVNAEFKCVKAHGIPD
jgi:hypothetical protein